MVRVILFGLVVAAPAMAEVSMPQVPDSSNNHTRFDAVPQYQERRRPIPHRNQANYLPLKPWLADGESFTREVGHAARPLSNLSSAAGGSQ
jgi:hypothetical protein